MKRQLIILTALLTAATMAADLRALNQEQIKPVKAQSQLLAQVREAVASQDVVTIEADNTIEVEDPYGFGAMILGFFLFPLSQVILWKNERKAVMFSRMIHQARSACISVNCKEPTEEDDYKLVHTSGQTVNMIDLCDKDFGVVAQDSYRLKRKVEMYQWRETYHQGKGNQRAYYTYQKVWSETPIDSTAFKNRGFDNPDQYWPFRSCSLQADSVKLGEYSLNNSQIERLGGSTKTPVQWSQSDQAVLHNASQTLVQAGFSKLQPKGSYLLCSATQPGELQPHVGQMRVFFEYDRCSTATVLAQQVADEQGNYSFRKWNPNKLNVPAGEKTDMDSEETYCGLFCCYLCMCVSGCFNTLFEEVVDHAGDEIQTAESYFAGKERALAVSTTVFRFLGVGLSVFGLFMLAMPFITLLQWIPLVGYFLGGVVAVAAFLLALVTGVTCSLVVISVAWLCFRPLLAMSLLALTGVVGYAVFIWDGSIPASLVL